MLGLLAQTWRSVISVVISVFLMVGSIFWAPEEYNRVLDMSGAITSFIVKEADAFAGAQGKAIARTMLDEGSFTATLYFLFTRILVLTLIIFVLKTLYELMFPAARKRAA